MYLVDEKSRAFEVMKWRGLICFLHGHFVVGSVDSQVESQGKMQGYRNLSGELYQREKTFGCLVICGGKAKFAMKSWTTKEKTHAN